MLFNSLQFLFFFIGVTGLYFAMPHRYRWLLLLIASCFFYMAFVPYYILILFVTIIIDYIAGIMIEKSSGSRRKRFLVYSLVANVGVLCIFKYYNFFNGFLSGALGFLHVGNPFPYMHILLPIGLSFHTFQAMSYTIEVYRGNQPAERHFGIYALYVMFYPQLVAGPIERPQNLLPQFRTEQYWDRERFKSGILLMMQGLFKKMVIADRLGMMVDEVYRNEQHYTGGNLLVAICFFSFQIYCDFSGYSDMAIGAARVMGIELMQNFRAPYLSRSIPEFWTRWHISLSTWFKDYLYIPLGGNRVRFPRWCFNILLVFMISGLWHGASIHFIIWGVLHGGFQIGARLKNRYIKQSFSPAWLQVITVFFLVSLAWLFFRLESITRISKALSGLFSSNWQSFYLNPVEVVYGFLLIAGLCLYDYHQTRNHFSHRRFYLKITVLAAGIYLLGVFAQNQFIYFQF